LRCGGLGGGRECGKAEEKYRNEALVHGGSWCQLAGRSGGGGIIGEKARLLKKIREAIWRLNWGETRGEPRKREAFFGEMVRCRSLNLGYLVDFQQNLRVFNTCSRGLVPLGFELLPLTIWQ
jgi:hypothetical protein